MSEFRRRLIAQSKGSEIPSGCTRCEYIKSTGTQYILTNHTLEDDVTIEVDFESLKPACTLFGSKSGSYRDLVLWTDYANTTFLNVGERGSMDTPFRFTGLTTGRHKLKAHIKKNQGTVWVDDVLRYDKESFAGIYHSGMPFAIFAAYVNGTPTEHNTSQVYSFSIKQGDVLVRNLLPILDKSGVPCLYDTVGEEFYYNKGTGKFEYKILGQ